MEVFWKKGIKALKNLVDMSKKDNTKEDFYDIGEAIQSHIEKEKASYTRVPAVGRAYCSLNSTLRGKEDAKQFWIVIGDTRYTLQNDGNIIHRDSKMGEILTKYHSGTRSYNQPQKYTKKVNTVNVTIHNREDYKPAFSSAQEITVYFDGDANNYCFQTLSDLIGHYINKKEQLKKKREEEETARKKKEEAKLAAEKAALEKALKEEAERLEEARRQEEEERKAAEERALLEKELEDNISKIKFTQSFIRKDLALRDQHFLDIAQEDAKRSHLYDGIPIVIEGGPGTGKTTTMIQRLKFLISQQALEEYDVPLSEEQILAVTDAKVRDNNWLYFSPTEKLLHYLQANMQGEYLNANENNTTTLANFRQKMLMEYKLRKPESDGPFKLYKLKSEDEITLVLDAKNAIKAFENFCISNITTILLNAYNLKTSEYSWHELALNIKAYCKRADVRGQM